VDSSGIVPAIVNYCLDLFMTRLYGKLRGDLLFSIFIFGIEERQQRPLDNQLILSPYIAVSFRR
jgi:hypothetical protein